MGHNDGGSRGTAARQAVLDSALCEGVQAAGGFVQDEHAGVFEQGPGKGHPLFLSATQPQAPLTCIGMVC